MSIFTDDAKGADKNTQELRRKAIAESGGMAMGSGHAIKDKEQKARASQEKAYQDQLLRLAAQLASPEEITHLLSRLDDLQTLLDQAFEELEDWKADVENRTVRLEDGTAVYRMEDGRFCTADGRVIPQSELPDDIPEDAATHKELKDMNRRAAYLAGIQDDMNQDRKKIESGDLTKKDVKDMDEKYDQIEADIDNPDRDRGEVRADVSASPDSLSFESVPLAP